MYSAVRCTTDYGHTILIRSSDMSSGQTVASIRTKRVSRWYRDALHPLHLTFLLNKIRKYSSNGWKIWHRELPSMHSNKQLFSIVSLNDWITYLLSAVFGKNTISPLLLSAPFPSRKKKKKRTSTPLNIGVFIVRYVLMCINLLTYLLVVHIYLCVRAWEGDEGLVGNLVIPSMVDIDTVFCKCGNNLFRLQES